jgi:hypothetical protein
MTALEHQDDLSAASSRENIKAFGEVRRFFQADEYPH